MKYEFHPEAELKFYQTTFRNEAEVPQLGLRFPDEIERVIQLLLEHPWLGLRVDENHCHFELRKFPFSLVYATGADIILVVAIAHGNRKPDYWRSRVQDY